jgi:two-component sensor histidine kinase
VSMKVSDTSDHSCERAAGSAGSGCLDSPNGCDLESVLSTAELTQRPSRHSDHAAENRALVALAQGLFSPRSILQKLVEVAIFLCGAQSAGISLLETDGQSFYWPAVAGRWAPHVGGSMPRDLSPCGTVLDRNAPQLFSHPERYFQCLGRTAPLIDEGLLIPFYVDGKAVGTIWIIAHDASCRFDSEDLRVMTNLAQFASAAYQTLDAREQLAAELIDTKLLQELSTQLMHEADTSALYEKIMDAAVNIMRSDFASMQMHYPERGNGGELRLLAFRGINPRAAKFWEWVRADSQCTCGVALRTGRRVVESNVETSDFLAGTADQAAYLQTGIHAVQSTPLASRDGKLVGMISTHWHRPHQPSERDLRLLDILARQAADLIERKQSEETQRMLLAELSHRVKNTLTTVQAIAGQTLRCAKSNSEFVENFNGRLQGLARAHSLLTHSSWAGAYLHEILHDQLTIEDGSDRVAYSGPVVFFSAQTALHLALVLHELGTNARKYGALSVPEGRLDLTWTVSNNGSESAIELIWAERNGPKVSPPDKNGLGSILIERSLESFGGTTITRFEPSGLRCTIRLPIESTRRSAASAAAQL